MHIYPERIHIVILIPQHNIEVCIHPAVIIVYLSDNGFITQSLQRDLI
jgi:hypothetical protein